MTLILGKIEGRRRRGQSMMGLSKLREMAKDGELSMLRSMGSQTAGLD